jgi:hypothetical protein
MFRKEKEAKFKLGTKGKDILSNFTGRLYARAEYITGCDQYQLKADALIGKEPATHWVDEGLIEIVDKDGVGVEAPETKAKYELGLKAKDKISGFKGVLYARVQYLSGVDRYVLVSEALPGKEPADTWINEEAVEIIEKEPVKPKQTKREKENGGPRLTPSNCRL